MTKEQIIWIIIGAIVIYYVLVYVFPQPMENFSVGNRPFAGPLERLQMPSPELIAQYASPTEGINDYLVDTKVCSKSCCGDNRLPQYDGLTSDEAQRAIIDASQNSTGPYVRTNYTCANGAGGVGCPCIDKPTYNFLVNHGSSSKPIAPIEPTFLLGGDLDTSNLYNTPYDELISQRSMFANHPTLNDLELRRTANPVNRVRSY